MDQQLPIGTVLTNKYSAINVQVTGWCELTKKYEARRFSDNKIIYIGQHWASSYELPRLSR